MSIISNLKAKYCKLFGHRWMRIGIHHWCPRCKTSGMFL